MTNPATHKRATAANPKRGEVSATINGSEEILCLTLGALASLEDWCGGNLSGFFERIGNGNARFADSLNLVKAGLVGAAARSGRSVSEALNQLDNAAAADAFPEVVRAAQQLLVHSFAAGNITSPKLDAHNNE